MALFTVAREGGHSAVEKIRDTYGHVPKERVRLPDARYREADATDISEARKESNPQPTDPEPTS